MNYSLAINNDSQKQLAVVALGVKRSARAARVLSIDGPLRNALYRGGGGVPGDNVVRSSVKAQPTPLVRAAMSATLPAVESILASARISG